MSSCSGKLRLRLVAIAVAVSAAVGGCDPTVSDSETGPAAPVLETDLRECPHTWAWEARYDEKIGATIEKDLEQLTRGAHHVPEYNDCQKFVIGQAEKPVYSAGQYAIFAVQNDSLVDALSHGDSVAVAVIFAEEDYGALGIKEHFNCLVLHAEGDDWVAGMYQPNLESTANCSGPFRGDGHRLTVRPPVSPLPADQGHYAKLARWGYDVDHRVHYMTVTCGQAVCHVGPSTGPFFVASEPTPLTTTSITDRERRVHEVAIWHDQQLLAGRAVGTDGLSPTDVWGTVIPDADLGDLNTLSQFNGWVNVAEVELSADHPDYTAKGFQMTTPGGVRNVVQSCVILANAADDPSDQCPDLPEEFLPGKERCKSSDDATPGESWRSRHIAVDGTIEYFCVRRYPLKVEGLEVPAAARWRWRANDELLWYRCMQGCCDEQV